jgi:RHS repeat-associated protein
MLKCRKDNQNQPKGRCYNSRSRARKWACGRSWMSHVRLSMLPERMRTDSRFSILRAHMDMELPDKGGTVVVRYQEPGGDSLEVDRLSYGEWFGLAAENAEVVDSMIDSLHVRDGLVSVLRTGYFMDPVDVGGGHVWNGGGAVGNSDPAVEPLPLPKPGVGSYLLSRGGKRYEFKDHLGDVLAVVSDLKLGKEIGTPDWVAEHYVGDILRMQDYYPFGMEMPKRGFVSEEYRYGYNGKEKDNEWNGSGNMIDYGFRVHDPRLGRFLSVDPLAPEYPELTTYQYASNTPVQAIDLDGLERWDMKYAPGCTSAVITLTHPTKKPSQVVHRYPNGASETLPDFRNPLFTDGNARIQSMITLHTWILDDGRLRVDQNYFRTFVRNDQTTRDVSNYDAEEGITAEWIRMETSGLVGTLPLAPYTLEIQRRIHNPVSVLSGNIGDPLGEWNDWVNSVVSQVNQIPSRIASLSITTVYGRDISVLSENLEAQNVALTTGQTSIRENFRDVGLPNSVKILFTNKIGEPLDKTFHPTDNYISVEVNPKPSSNVTIKYK